MDNNFNNLDAIKRYQNRKENPENLNKLTFFEHFRSFIVAFMITFLCITVIFATTFIPKPNDKTAVIGTADIPKKSYNSPTKDDRMNILLTISENENILPEVYMLLGFLPDKGYISVTLIPPNSYIFSDYDELCPNDFFKKGGTAYTAKGVSKFFDINIDRYGTLYYKDIDNFTSKTGSFLYNVQATLNYPHHRRHVSLAKGMTELNGRNLCDILFYPAYLGGEQERSDLGTMVTVAFLNNLILNKSKNHNLDILTPFFDYFDTNISSLDIETHIDALNYIINQNDRTILATYIDGELSQDYTYFLLTQDAVNRIKSVYG